MTGTVVDHEYSPKANVECLSGTHRDTEYRAVYDRVTGYVQFGIKVNGEWDKMRAHEHPGHVELQELCDVWVTDRLAKLDRE